jgi:hypothetical protein
VCLDRRIDNRLHDRRRFLVLLTPDKNFNCGDSAFALKIFKVLFIEIAVQHAGFTPMQHAQVLTGL